MNNLIVIASFVICFIVVIFGIVSFLMAFRSDAFSNDKKKAEKIKKFGRIVLILFIVIFIIGFIFMIYILWKGFSHG